MAPRTIILDKYTLVLEHGHIAASYREGRLWRRDFTGDGLVIALLEKIDQLERTRGIRQREHDNDKIASVIHIDRCSRTFTARMSGLGSEIQVGDIMALPPSPWEDIKHAPKNGMRVFLQIENVDRPVLGFWSGAAWTTIDDNNWEGRKVLAYRKLPTLTT